MHARLTRVGPPAVALLVLAAIGLIRVGGPGGSAMAMGDCVGPGCERGIACDRAAATGPAASSHPGNLPAAVTFDVERGRTPEQAWATGVSPPLRAIAGPVRTCVGPRSPPTV